MAPRVWPRPKAKDKPRTRQDLVLLQPDLEDILSQEAPSLVRNTHYIVAGMFVGLIVIASLVTVDIIVAATGRLVADSPTIVVQPLQLSIIRDIKVKAGDIVHKGDVLATLDATFTQADQAALTAQNRALQAHIARLEAELIGTVPKLDNGAPDDVLQLTLYSQRVSQYASRLQAFDENIKHYETTLVATEKNRVSMARQLDIAREVENMRAKLYNLQVGSKLNHLDSQVLRMRYERDYEDTASRLNELRHSLSSKRAERQVFIDEWCRNLLEDMVKARTESASLAENLVKASRMNDLVVLSAPADGFVLEVAKRSVGSVIQAAEPVVTMVPTSAGLISEIMINSADVGYTKLGDEVAIKMDAFPYQRHGVLTGRLRSIGQDSISPNGAGAAAPAAGQPIFHRSHVELTNTKLQALPEGAHLIPGMTLTAEIKVGARSVISYFLYPISRGFSESIREP